MQFIYNYNDQGGMVDISIFFLLTISYHHIVIFNNTCDDDIMFIYNCVGETLTRMIISGQLSKVCSILNYNLLYNA